MAESIADPAQRAGALIEVVDALPAAQRARKLALLDRAALHARAAADAVERLWRIGDAAERLHELGEVEKAKAALRRGPPPRQPDDGQDGVSPGLLRRAARRG